MDIFGQTPCCVASVTVPGLVYQLTESMVVNGQPVSYYAGDLIPLGNVMGTCDFRKQTASITWLGKQYQQPFSNGKALYVKGLGEWQTQRHKDLSG